MANTLYDALEEALEDLGENQFKKFTHKLTDPGFQGRMKTNAVEKKDRGDIARLMIQQYTDQRALEFALQILRNIKANQTAADLEKNAAALGFSVSAGSGETTGTVTPNANPGGSSCPVGPTNDASKAAFIDGKWTELVQRATGMDAILDILLSKRVINDEQYTDLYSEKTQQKKMRLLIQEALKACGASGKAVLYDVLMDKQPFMMKDMGAS